MVNMGQAGPTNSWYVGQFIFKNVINTLFIYLFCEIEMLKKEKEKKEKK